MTPHVPPGIRWHSVNLLTFFQSPPISGFPQWFFPILLKCLFHLPSTSLLSADHILKHKARASDVKRLPSPSFSHEHISILPPSTPSQRVNLLFLAEAHFPSALQASEPPGPCYSHPPSPFICLYYPWQCKHQSTYLN